MLEADLEKITEMAERVAVSEGLTLVDVSSKGVAEASSCACTSTSRKEFPMRIVSS